MRIAVGAIVKNEAPYLLEWIAWHQVVGVDHFVLYDNDSDDGTTELLAGLDRAGVVTHVPFPDVPGRRPQMYAYEHLFAHHADVADWIAVIDADEFLVPTGSQSLTELLDAQPADTGCVLAHWACYGSSGLQVPDDATHPSPVMERFRRRGHITMTDNGNVKGIYRPEATCVTGRWINVHELPLRAGYVYRRPDGTAVPSLLARSGDPLPVDWAALRINHYVVKSRAEFLLKKRARGDAANVLLRPHAMFDHFEAANEVDDPPDAEVLRTVAARAATLRAMLSTTGSESWEPDPLRVPPELVQGIHGVEALSWCRREGDYVMDGWALGPWGTPLLPGATLRLHVGAVSTTPRVVIAGPRPDVVAEHPWASLYCGVRAVFSGLPAPRGRPCILEISEPGNRLALEPVSIRGWRSLPGPQLRAGPRSVRQILGLTARRMLRRAGL